MALAINREAILNSPDALLSFIMVANLVIASKLITQMSAKTSVRYFYCLLISLAGYGIYYHRSGEFHPLIILLMIGSTCWTVSVSEYIHRKIVENADLDVGELFKSLFRRKRD